MAHENGGDYIAVVLQDAHVSDQILLFKNVLVAELKDDLADGEVIEEQNLHIALFRVLQLLPKPAEVSERVMVIQNLVVMVMQEAILEYEQRVGIKLWWVEATLVKIFALGLFS